ncbi:hypothetical protein ACQ4PT_018849 [Festuca glaucescens]
MAQDYTPILLSAAAAAALLLLLISSTTGAAAPAPTVGMPGCDTRCGNMSVPYPFGMGPSHCYHSPGFNLSCDHGRILLGNGTFQVAEDIYPSFPRLTVVHTGDIQTDGSGRGTFGDDSPFSLSGGNQLILIGCNVRATLRNGNVTMSGCSSFCANVVDEGRTYMPSRLERSMLCSGICCCQAPIVVNREVVAGSGELVPITSYDVELDSFGWNRSEARELPAHVFIARDGWFAPMSISHQLLSKKHQAAAPMEVPFWLDWEVTIGQQGTSLSGSWECPGDAARTVCRSNHADCTRGERGGYTCSCKNGYEGNPYISNGCQDINECEHSESNGCFGECTNTDGLYKCECPWETHGDPYTPGGCFPYLTGKQYNCITSCGNMSVQYPFGIGPPGCYLPGFNLTCDTSNHHPPRLMLHTFQVVDISLLNNTVHVVSTDLVLDMYVSGDGSAKSVMGFRLWDEWPYSLSTRNELILIGCGVQAGLLGAGKPAILIGCSSFCPSNEDGTYIVYHDEDEDQYCYGIGCCKARIAMSRDGWPKEFWIDWMVPNSAWDKTSPHSYVFVAEEGWFRKRHVPTELPRRAPSLEIPIVLDWEVLQLRSAAGSRPPANLSSQQQYLKCPGICSSKNSLCKPRIRGYTCHCVEGYAGNPYLVDGCKGQHALYFSEKKKMKHKFFEQNRGQLLQQLVSQKADIAERMIISLEELKKATNNFDKARELGGGGHGTVYKGILSDLHVVPIKKPKKVIQKEIDEFINEVAILSQINHRNVVKLYGCCLETEVPMLVYEFISNGTLHGHLHVQGPKSLSWDDRLRIAIETSKSIAYLHSTASIPIIHRDIKSVNILLDVTLTSKVADFGASRYVPVDKSGLTTMVQGTIGYMDPMYFYTGRLTEKSDVYGFGVMLVELLTRQKPFLYTSSEGDGLVAHFSALFAEGKLSQILDPQIIEEGGKEVDEVAAIAVACIKLTGEGRPTMRQVELTLESVQSPKHLGNVAVTKSEKVGPSIDCSWIEGGRSYQESTRQYSMEQEFEISATYPR